MQRKRGNYALYPAPISACTTGGTEMWCEEAQKEHLLIVLLKLDGFGCLTRSGFCAAAPNGSVWAASLAFLPCLDASVSKMWLQPAEAPVAEEMVVIPCVPVAGLCIRFQNGVCKLKIDGMSPPVLSCLWRAPTPRSGVAPALGRQHGREVVAHMVTLPAWLAVGEVLKLQQW
ncbi:hypothetical protein BTVI_109896 [Pitangus sulphuratus]|nr:hypothetical protein BTVI_109896 [Pitangus sulphuratus]